MPPPKVRLLLKGEPVQEVPFPGEVLRIGRMKENDLVINNLSVSRFHATLSKRGEFFVLKDLGSENGVWVNGRRVKETRVGPGDRVQVGKHQLEILLDGAAAAAPEAPAPAMRSDAWDAAPASFAGPETQAKMIAAPAAEGEAEAVAQSDLEPLDTDGELTPEPEPDEIHAGDPVGDLFGRVDSVGVLAGPDLAEFDVSEMDLRTPEEATELVEPSDAAALPALGAPVDAVADLLETDPESADGAPEITDLPALPEEFAQDEPAAAPAAPPAEDALFAEPPEAAPIAQPPAAMPAGVDAPLPPGVHAGLIVQRGGHLERVVAWESDRMTLGRATECDVLLATPEVSRRHAMLVREDDRYEVRDLESINGTHVNGEKVSRRALASGDVIRVEDFELTFVLDNAPVAEAVKDDPKRAPAMATADPGMTQIGDMLDLAPFVSDEQAEPIEAMSFDALAEPTAQPVSADDAPAGAPAHEDLVSAEAEPHAPFPAMEADMDIPALGTDDLPAPFEEPPTALLPADPDEEKDLAPAPRDARVLRLELRVRIDELPPALREALAHLDPESLRLPVEVRLATED